MYISGPQICCDKSADPLQHSKIWNTPTHIECKIGSREYKQNYRTSMVCAIVHMCVFGSIIPA